MARRRSIGLQRPDRRGTPPGVTSWRCRAGRSRWACAPQADAHRTDTTDFYEHAAGAGCGLERMGIVAREEGLPVRMDLVTIRPGRKARGIEEA